MILEGLALSYHLKHIKWAQVVVVEEIIDNEIQGVPPKVYTLTADNSNFENKIYFNKYGLFNYSKDEYTLLEHPI